MEARIKTLETKWDTVIPTLATKSDVSDAVLKLTHWIIGTAVAFGAVGLTVMTFVLNNAVPKAPPAPMAQQAPIIINVPGPAPVANPAPRGKH